MVFTFDNEDFVLQQTLECCIDMFWNLRPEACDEMLFDGCTQRITAPEEAANKARHRGSDTTCQSSGGHVDIRKYFCLCLPALEEHDLSTEHGDSVQDQIGIACVWGYWWCGFWIKVDIFVWACLLTKGQIIRNVTFSIFSIHH